MVLDDELSYQLSGHIISTALGSQPDVKKIIFLYNSFQHPFGCKLAAALEQRGEQVEWVRLQDEMDCPEAAHIISTIDLEGPYLAEVSRENYNTLMTFVQKLTDGLLWLTRAAQVRCTQPEYGIGLGLFRTIRNELSMQLWTLEIDELIDISLSAAVSVIEKFKLRPSDSTGRTLDAEYISQHGVIHVGRYHWTSTQDELMCRSSSDTKQIVVEQYGILNSMRWIKQPPRQMQGDEVQVQIRSVGLNFKVRYSILSSLSGICC